MYQRCRFRFVFFILVLIWCLVLSLGSISSNATEEISELVKRLSPYVVTLATYDANGNFIEQGSGFLVSKMDIITCYHVIDSAIFVKATLSTGEVWDLQGIIHKDEESDLVELSGVYSDLAPLILSDSVEAGQHIIVIGSPFGLSGAVSNGIISRISDRFLQITAPVSPGSSGSPVFNLQGELVGVVKAHRTIGQLLNYATPAAKIKMFRDRSVWGRWMTFAEERVEKDSLWAESAEGHYSLGKDYMRFSGGESEAIHEFKKAIELDTKLARAYYELALCYENLDSTHRALNAYKKVVLIQSSHIEAYERMAKIYFENNRYQEAEEACKHALQLPINHWQNHDLLGLIYDTLGQLQGAVEQFKIAIRNEPLEPSLHDHLGLVYYKSGQPERAIEEFKTAIEIDQKYQEAYIHLYSIYRSQGRNAEAEEIIRKTPLSKLKFIDLKPIKWIPIKADNRDHTSAIFYDLGEAFEELGAYDTAVVMYTKAIEEKWNFWNAHFNLGRCYLHIGKRLNALQEYKILKGMDEASARKLFDLIYPP